MNGLLGNAAYYMQRQQPGGLLPAGPASFQGTGGGRMLSAPAGLQQAPSKFGNLGQGMAALGAGIESFATAYKAKQEAEKTKAQWQSLFTPTQTQGGPTVQNAATAPIFSMVPGMTPEKAQFLQMVGPEKGMPWIQAQVLKEKEKPKLQEFDPTKDLYLGNELVRPGVQKPEKESLTNLQKEYNMAVSQGYKGSFTEYRDEDAAARRSQTKIENINIPAGYQLKTSPSGERELEPVKGGPVDLAQQEAAKKEADKAKTKSQTYRIMTDDISRARQLVLQDPGWTTGFFGGILEAVPGTKARDLQALLDTIKTNVSIDKIQQMRDQSKTGAALGSITDDERRAIGTLLGNLENSQKADQLLYNLNRLEDYINELVNGEGSPSGGGTNIVIDRDASSQSGIPLGSTFAGTSKNGKPVYLTPDGRRLEGD